MGPDLEQACLGLLGGHLLGVDEPAEDHRSASGASGFAMNVDLPSLAGNRVDKFHPPSNILQSGWVEIDGGEPELLDFVMLVFGQGSSIFLAHIDDPSDSKLGEFGNIAPQRKGPEIEFWGNLVPPMPSVKHAGEAVVPGEGREKQRS